MASRGAPPPQRRIKRVVRKFEQKVRLLLFIIVLPGVIAATLLGISLVLVIPIFQTYLETGLVPRLPTAILATGIVLLAFINLACGLIVDTVTLGRREAKRMRYRWHQSCRGETHDFTARSSNRNAGSRCHCPTSGKSSATRSSRKGRSELPRAKESQS